MEEQSFIEQLISEQLPYLNRFRPIDTGGFSEVYRAERRDGKSVAIKFYSDPYQQGISPEDLLAWTKLNPEFYRHKGLVRPYEKGTVTGIPYVVMDWANGTCLSDMIEDNDLTWEYISRITNQLFRTLEHFHKWGLVHGDIKDHQIVGMKLIDYDTIRPDPYANHDMAVTPEYAAPEEINDFTKTHTTDVAHATAVVHKMLFGYAPMEALLPVDPEVEDIVQAFRYKIQPEVPHDAQIQSREIWNWIFSTGMHPDHTERPNARNLRKVLKEAIKLEKEAGTPIYHELPYAA